MQLQTASPDLRHAVVCEDVEDVSIDGLDCHCSPGGEATIRLTDGREVLVRGCRPKAGTELFLKLRGARSERIVLTGNDLSGVGKIADVGPDVAKSALAELANYIGE